MMDSNRCNTDDPQPMCSLCGLACPVSMFDELASEGAARCPRLSDWRNRFDLRTSEDRFEEERSDRLHQIKIDSSSLIWLDGTDVRTTRHVVRMAQRTGATIHVGQSPGSPALKRVMRIERWHGTTLAEIASQCDLIVTIGDGVLTESPLLIDRFWDRPDASVNRHWFHITSESVVDGGRATRLARQPDRTILVERRDWYAFFTLLALELDSQAETLGGAKDPNLPMAEAVEVAGCIVQHRACALVWDIDDLYFDVDETILRRLASIARIIHDREDGHRCGLLPIDMQLGRLTAEETLMWMTGHASTIRWRQDRWDSPSHVESFSIDDWQTHFETIVLVNNVARLKSSPNLNATLSLQTSAARGSNEIQVASVGVDDSGHLFRGDKAFVGYYPATCNSQLKPAVYWLQTLESHVSKDKEDGR